MPDDFSHVIEQVPEEQRRVLERMMGLGLVVKFGWNDSTKLWFIRYTPSGKKFLRLVHAVVSPDTSHREASLIALDLLADDKGGISGFAKK
jgi:hypothetical protein